MEIKKQIESILLQFLSDEISKENLCKWAIDVLHKILKGDIFYVKYLEMYGIITELAGIDDLDNDECKKSARRLIRILLGDECASYCFAMQIPKKFVVDNLVEVHEILCKYSSGQHLSVEEIQKIKSLTQKKVHSFNKLNEIFEYQIIDLLMLGYGINNEDNVQFCLKSTIYVSEDMALALEDSLMAKLIALLKCYEGEKSFFVSTYFINGISNISIQV